MTSQVSSALVRAVTCPWPEWVQVPRASKPGAQKNQRVIVIGKANCKMIGTFFSQLAPQIYPTEVPQKTGMLENVQFWERVRRTSFSPQSSTPEKFSRVNPSWGLYSQPEVTHEILLLHSHFAECLYIGFCSHARGQADSQSAQLKREGASFAVLSPVRLFWKRRRLFHPPSLGHCSSPQMLTDG